MQRSSYYTVIAMIVSLGGFLFGFDASVISGVAKYIKPQFQLTDLQLGWVVSSPTFSAMFAMLAAGTISDRIGRKPVLIAVAFLYALSAIWSAMAGGYESLYLARMVGGVAFGAALVLAPAYIAEISPAAKRGQMVSIQQLNIVLGFSAAYFSNYFLQGALESAEWLNEENIWRWMLGIEFVPAILYFLLMFIVPRSPRWLYLKGKTEAGLSTLKQLFGDQIAKIEAQNIQQSLQASSSMAKASLKQLFNPSLRFVILIGLAIGILQQVTGVNAIYFYATTIFEQSGIGTNAAFAQAVWVGIINVVFTIVAMGLIDRMGRKPLLLIGMAGIAVSMMLTAYGFNQATYTLNPGSISKIEGLPLSLRDPIISVTYENDVEFKQAVKEAIGPSAFAEFEGQILTEAIEMNPILILVGILGFVASFAISLGPVMWVMLSEMYPNWIRGLAISTIGFINSFSSWFVQFIFPWELNNLGNAGTYLIYGILAALGFFLMFRVLPETKGKSLEEIEAELVK